jgi:hypothetical protein
VVSLLSETSGKGSGSVASLTTGVEGVEVEEIPRISDTAAAFCEDLAAIDLARWLRNYENLEKEKTIDNARSMSTYALLWHRS